MAKKYTLTCEKCNFKETYRVGTDDNRAAWTELLCAGIEAGEYGAEAQQFYAAHKSAEILGVRAVFRCSACGNIEERIKLTLSDDMYEFVYRNICTKCGDRMAQVTDIAGVHCPTCKVPLNAVEEVAL